MAEARGVVDLEEAKDQSTDASEVADELEKEESGGLGCSETVEEVKVGASVSSAETEKQAAKEEESAAGSPADRDPVDGGARVDAVEGISPSEKKESVGDAQVTTPLETEVPLVDDDQKSQEADCTEVHRTEDTKLTDTAVEMHPQVSSKETNQDLQEEDGRIASHVDLIAKDPVLDDLCRGEPGVCDVDMVDAAHASVDPEPVDEVGVVHAQSLGSESEANDESRLNLQKEDLASQPDRVAKEQPPSNSTVEVQNQEIGGEIVVSNKPVIQGRDHKASIRNIEEGDAVLDTAPVDDTLGHQADRGVADTNLADTAPEVQAQVKEGHSDVGRGSVMDDYYAEDEDASISKTNPVVTDKSNEEGDSSFDSGPVGDVIDHQAEPYLDDPTGKALAKGRDLDTDVDDGYIKKVDEVKDGVRGVHQVSSLQISSIETNQGLQEEDDGGIASHVDLVAKDPVLDDLCRGEMGVCDVDMVDAAHASADPEPVDVVGVVHAQSLGSESEANDESRLNLQKEDLASQPDRVTKEQPPSNSTVELQNQEIGGETVESNKPVMDDSQGRDHKASIRNIEEGDVVLDTALVVDTLGHQADHGVVDTNLADTVPEVQAQVKEGDTDVGCGSVMDDYHTKDEDASNSKMNPVVTDKSNEEGDSSFDSVPVGDVIDHQAETYLDDPTGKALAKGRDLDTDVDDGYIMKVDEVKDGVRGVHEVSSLQISKVETSQDLQEGDNELKPNHIDSNIDSPADLVKDSITDDPEVEVQPQATGSEMEVANVEFMDVDQDSNVGITAGPNQADPVVEEVQTQVICQESEAGNETMMNLPNDTTTVGDIINLQADCVSEHANLDDLAVKSHSEIRSIETDDYDGFMMKSGEGKDHKVSGSHTSLTETNQNSQVKLEIVLDSVPVEADHFTKHPDQVNLVKEPEVSAGSDVDGDQEREREASACESSLMKTNQQIQEEGNTSFNPVLDEAVDYQAVRAAEDKSLITRGSVITTTLDGLGTLSVAEAEKEDANPVIDEPLGSGYSLKPGMHLSPNFADLAAASSESLPVQVCAMTKGDTTTVGFGCVADSSCAEEQEAFVSKMHLVENTHEDEKLLDSFSVGDNINHQADCASQDPDPEDPSIELKARIENIEADGCNRFVMEGDENKDQEASLFQASLTATNQDVLEESDTLLNYVPPEADYYTNNTNQVNQSMGVKSVIVRTEIEASDAPEVDTDQEASALKSSLVEIQGEGNTMFNSVSVDDTIDHEVNCMPLDKDLTTGFGIVTSKLDGVMSVSLTELENGDVNSVNDSSLGSKYSVVSGAGLTQNFVKFGAQSADTHPPVDENTMVQGDVTKADANPVIELQSQDTQMVDHNLVGKQDITELVSCSVVEPVNCGIGSLGEKLMVTGDTVLENSNSVVETNTWRASELSEIHTVLSQGKGYIDLLQDADLDIEMQAVGISVDESICANAHKLESSLGKSQIIITDSEVVNNGMPQASACKRVESIQELEGKEEIQDPNNEGSSLKDEDADGKQNVKVGKRELLKRTEKQAVKCLDTSIGGIPGMENKQHISYNLIFVDTANFSLSDLVWGKVKSHPWWPGQIIDPSDASKLALKYQKKDNFLVAYFGDKTFAWCDDSQLKPFYSYFSQMEKQCSSDTFATAMNDILVEISRRVELGMTCSCFPDESYANIKFQKVDNAGVRKGNVTSFLDHPQVLNYFQPGELVEYIKTLAQFPNGGVDRLELVIAKSQLKSFYCSKGYPELPIFTVHGELIQDVAEIPLSNVKGSGEDNAEHSTPDVPGLGSGKGKLRSSDKSSKKRKHVLEDDGKQKSMSGLTNEENALHLGDDGKSKCGLEASETLILSSSGMKHTVLGSDSTDSGRHKIRTLDFFGDVEPTSPSPTVISSFKIGEFIRRAASQLTGAPPIVKCQQESTPKNALQTDPRKGVVTDFDVLPHAPEENKEQVTSLSEKNSSPDEMLSQLCLAARDPMNGDSSVSMIVDFFSSFRNSCVSCIREGKKHVEKRKRGRPRKVISQPLFSELFSDISSSEEKPVEKRKRCRPKKYSDTAISDIGSSEEKHVKKCSSENQHVEKRRRGRPKKVISQPAVSDIGSSEEKHAEKPKRGRPRKVTSQLASSDMSTPDHMKDSYWSDTNLEKRPRKKSLSDLKRKGESHEQIRQKKRKSAGGRPLSLPSVSVLENEQKLQLVAMNTNIKYSFIAERPIISVAEKIVDERMPTALILSFSSSDTLPSPTDLIRIFSRYGPLKEAETDVVIKTNRAKVVFKRRVDAEAAFSSAGKYSIFGPGLLSYQLKSMPLTTKPSQQTTQENHDTTSIVMPQDNLNPTISTLQGDHDQAISVAQNEHDEDLMTTPQDKHDITASASKPEENHVTASVVIPQDNLKPTIATLQGDHDQVISVAQIKHDEDPMTTPQDNHDTTSASKPEENHDTASIVIPQENLNPTTANLQGDHDQAISVAPNVLMTTPQDESDTTMVSRPQNDDSGAITTPDETKDAELIHGCNLETSEVAEDGFALDNILVEAEAKLSPQVKHDVISIPQPEYHDAASIPTPEKKKDAGLMQGRNLEISEVAEGGIALDTILVEAEAELPQGKYDATSIPHPKEYHDAAPIAAPQDKLDSTTITTSGEYHDAAPITSTQDQYETTQIESSSSLTEDKYDAALTTEHSGYHDAAPIVASPDYHDATPNTASQEYQDATPTTALQENYEATQEQSETVMEVDKIQVETEEESSRSLSDHIMYRAEISYRYQEFGALKGESESSDEDGTSSSKPNYQDVLYRKRE